MLRLDTVPTAVSSIHADVARCGVGNELPPSD